MAWDLQTSGDVSRAPVASPVIAVCGPDEGGTPAWWFTSKALRRRGARPVRVTPARGGPQHDWHGLVLGGGADVTVLPPQEPEQWAPPTEPGQAPARTRARVRRAASYVIAPMVFFLRRLLGAKRSSVDHGRDQLENALLLEALETGRPVLGICRGAQLINVALGGTLHRDLSSFYVEQANPWTVFPRKRVRVESQSRLATALGTQSCAVNSLHRNAINNLGRGLRVVAMDESGVVQAVENSAPEFIVGVQWHPEYMPQRPEQRRLFGAFVEAARTPTTARLASRAVEGVA